MWNTLFKQLKSSWETDALYTRTVSFFVYRLWLKLEALTAPARKYAASASMVVFVMVASVYVLVPGVANADMEQERVGLDALAVQMIISAMQNETEQYGVLPVSGDAPARRSYTIPMTAYTSEVWQTDDTPCITASGLDVCERDIENVVAANFLPIGTRVRIPELYGDRVFYVEDRMNARYYYKMDVWMRDLQDAKNFGLKFATVEVF